MTRARVVHAGNVVTDYEASSAVTLVGNSLAEHDEKHRRADGRACIALGKGFLRELKAEEKLAAENGQRDTWEERLQGQRP